MNAIFLNICGFQRCHDIQHNDILHNDTQHEGLYVNFIISVLLS
jgi:hypothetical protein